MLCKIDKTANKTEKNYCPFDDTHNNCSIVRENSVLSNELTITTVLVDTRLWRTKHPRRRFQNFRQSYTLSSNRIEIHQSQPLVWCSDLLYVLLARWNWWISIRFVDNMYDCDNLKKRTDKIKKKKEGLLRKLKQPILSTIANSGFWRTFMQQADTL